MSTDGTGTARPHDCDRRAVRAYAAHLAGRAESGRAESGRAAIDDLCRAHPELEPSLRELDQKRASTTFRAPRVEAGRIAGVRERLARGGAHRHVEEAAVDAPRAESAVSSARGSRAIERYVLLGEVARGGMGVVLHVWDTVLERPLAMKVLDTEAHADNASETDEAMARFLAEAQVAAQLDHPGVVPIYDLGADESGRPFFTMPLIHGRDLDEVFDLARDRQGGWSLTRAMRMVAKLCEVVAYAHSRGVIHRDLKPANVMVGEFGELYVVDWGLAKFVDRAERERAPAGAKREHAPARAEREHATEPSSNGTARAGETLDGTVAGTPPYLAPEQALGRVTEVSFRADVYALGAILYRLLAGRAPYAPRHGRDDPATTLELVRRGPPTPLSRVAPGAPAELVAISEKAMAWKPEDRYPSVDGDLARDLDLFLESRLAGARRRGFWTAAKDAMFGRARARGKRSRA